MAYIVFRNGTAQSVSAKVGHKLWNGLLDPTGLDDNQLTYLNTIKRVYLNWRNAPQSYLDENRELLEQMYGSQSHTQVPAWRPYKE